MAEARIERRRDDARVRELVAQVAALTVDVAANSEQGGRLVERVAQLSVDVAANTELTKRIEINTAGIVELMASSERAGVKFVKLVSGLNWILRKVLPPFVAIAAVAYALWHGGRPPEFLKDWINLFK